MSSEAPTAATPTPKKPKKLKDKSLSSEKKRKRSSTSLDINASPPKKFRPTKPPPTTSTTATTNGEATLPSQSVDLSPFHHQTSSLYLPLSPISQLHPLRGLCAEHLSPLILTYYPPFRGVILSYGNARLSEHPRAERRRNLQDNEDGRETEEKTPVLALSVDEYAASFVWVTAEFLVFRPQRGGWIEGWVNLQNEGHLGLVCWNLFNASINRRRLPKEWKWVAGGLDVRAGMNGTRGWGVGEQEHSEWEQERRLDRVENGEGHFEDAEGRKIEGRLRFRVRDVETTSSSEREKGFLSIEGTLLSPEDEMELTEQETVRLDGRERRTSMKRWPKTMSGALDDRINGETNGNGAQLGESRHMY